jgi:sialate O-acetylesterase
MRPIPFVSNPRSLTLLALVVLGGAPASAEVRLARIFSDNMMLQRDKPVRVWGSADPDEAVKVSLNGKNAATKAGANGQWSVELAALKAGEDLELQVEGKNTITLRNVMIGDIWVCSGQSNMEWRLEGCLGWEADSKAADLPKIRRIKMEHVQAATPQDEAPITGPWQVCNPDTVRGFTAVGFYFAREVQAKTGVPIGIIDVNWGGTRIEPWIAVEGIGMVKELEGTSPAANGGWCGMYNAMIHPLVRMPIKGALWYQGESNGGEGETYYDKMRALIGGWRKQWGQGDFPFYFTQLASFQAPNENPAGGDGWAKHREGQRKSLTVPNTGMAVSIDTVPLAQAGDIHPGNKYDVGIRLARWALNRDYGMKDLVVSGPLFKELKISGSKAVVSFDHVGGGLTVAAKVGREPAVADSSGKLQRFAIAGEDQKWVWADAVVQGSTVVVSSPEVPKPVAVRYAFSQNPHGANLYNKEGLPASPFRTDNW